MLLTTTERRCESVVHAFGGSVSDLCFKSTGGEVSVELRGSVCHYRMKYWCRVEIRYYDF